MHNPNQVYILQRELVYISTGGEHLQKFVKDIPENDTNEDSNKKIESIEEKIQIKKNQLINLKQKRAKINQRRRILSQREYDLYLLRTAIESKCNNIRKKYTSMLSELDSVKDEADRTIAQLQRFNQINILNDAFYIWYSGPYATINNFRLGNLLIRPIEWVEINAALGQCVLAVATVAAKVGLEFKKYYLHPMGSHSKLSKMDDRKTIHTLYIDQSFSLFPKTNFNKALVAFLTCLKEFAEHIYKHDPTLALPYAINTEDGTVNDTSVCLGVDENIWTKGLKYMLSDIKWIIAWAGKHSYDFI